MSMDIIDIDKNKFLELAADSFQEEDLFSSDYYYKMKKDGLYIDIIKKLTTTYNIQRIEQRLIREVSV